MSDKQTNIVKDASGRKLIITRNFNAPLANVWKAWTDGKLLENWWAPKPYKAVTKEMYFTDGGRWLYAMVSPEGEKHWCRVDFSAIEDGKSFTAASAFCDEEGVVNSDMPLMDWHNTFKETAEGTLLTAILGFETEAGLDQIVQMGFKEGFTMALGNLDEVLARQ